MVTNEARRRSPQGSWTSRLAFVLALSGAAVGLGNIWKFPYIAGVNGGGAFVLIYLVCVFAVGLPIMMSEILIGRRGRRNPIATMGLLGEEESGNRKWYLVGLLGVGGSFIILSYYSVVAGWAVAYILRKRFRSLSAGAGPDQIAEHLWRADRELADVGVLAHAFHGHDRFCRCSAALCRDSSERCEP